MSDEQLDRIVWFCIASLLFIVPTIYFFVIYEEKPPMPLECIEKLEQFAGEDSFSVYSCQKDLSRASKLRAERAEVCQ